VRYVVEALRAVGIDCFFDIEAIEPLADFPARIRQGIAESHAVLAWWSTDYAESGHCLEEFLLAWRYARRQRPGLFGRRLLILNPERSARHIHAGELDAQNFLQPPAPSQEAGWAASVLSHVRELMPYGPLASEIDLPPPTPLRNVPHVPDRFTGRGRELMRIHSKLHPVRIGSAPAGGAVQTHGLGGVGKTGLAIKYARTFADSYPGGVVWLNLAPWEPGLTARLEDAKGAWQRAVEAAYMQAPDPELSLTDPEGRPLAPDEVRRRLICRCQNGPAFLWVLDNVPVLTPESERRAILDWWRAPSPNGYTLMTTRDGRPAEGFHVEPLGVMNEDDALHLLARYRAPTSHDDRDAALSLVREVGAHTQALVLLGERLGRNAQQSFRSGLQQLHETGRLARIDEVAVGLKDHLGDRGRGIVATFALSIEPLADPARRLLAVAAVCAPNTPIPDSLLESASGLEGDTYGDARADLIGRSLLEQRSSTDVGHSVVEIHPLLSDAAARLLGLDMRGQRTKVADALLPLLANASDSRAYSRIAPLIPHAESLGETLETSHGVDLKLRVGLFFFGARFQFEAAWERFHAATERARRVLAEGDELTLKSMAYLAQATGALGDRPAARELLEAVVVMSRRALGEAHPLTLDATGSLCGMLSRDGDHEASRTLLQDAVNRARGALGNEHPTTLGLMFQLAMALHRHNDHSTAKLLLGELVETSSRVLGDGHGIALGAANALALILRQQGDLPAARSVLEGALARARSESGDEPAVTQALVLSLALILVKQRDFAGARTLLETSIATHQNPPDSAFHRQCEEVLNLLSTSDEERSE
jgi:hypothetical protein